MAIVLGLDFETTGTDPETCQVIEVGAVLFNGVLGQMIEAHSWLVSLGEEKIPEEVVKLTGITNEALFSEGQSLGAVDEKLSSLIRRSNYLCAHNHQFEKTVLGNCLGLSGIEANNMRWIDTMTDLPEGKGNSNLTFVAASHDTLNPFPHRALTDVLTMLKVLSRYDFAEVERYAQSPTQKLIIHFPYDVTGQRNNQVKSLGYRWNGDYKHWWKSVKEFQIAGEQAAAAQLGFTASLLLTEAIPA